MSQTIDISWRIGHTYAWTGAIGATSGSTYYFPPFRIPIIPGQRALLIGMYPLLRAGTLNVSLLQNNSGTGLSDLTNVAASTADNYYELTTFQDIANGDKFQISASTPASSPDGLSAVVVVEYIITVDIK